MGRIFLTIYVAIHIFILVIALIATIKDGTAQHILSKDDWLLFIIAASALSITEALEKE